MRTGKELILATRLFAQENRVKSWFEILLTLALIVACLWGTLAAAPLLVRLFLCIVLGFLYVRLFVIYHDYQHHAILQKSTIASLLMKFIGVYLLAPQTIWKRSHDHHHSYNSKLTTASIGSYPTVSKERFLVMSKAEQQLYLINRHPLTILLGYFTLFIYWLNIKSLLQSPSRHIDSLLALFVHVVLGGLVAYLYGAEAFMITWFTPFLIAFAMGSYLFYCQHNFPKAVFRENQDWTYDSAALSSSSFMTMNPIMHWFTGHIGYHHVHHMNSRIPFYRLKEVMKSIPELQNVEITSWSPFEMYRCFRLKLWDAEKGKMIRMDEL